MEYFLKSKHRKAAFINFWNNLFFWGDFFKVKNFLLSFCTLKKIDKK
jgi:hypothetical protein